MATSVQIEDSSEEQGVCNGVFCELGCLHSMVNHCRSMFGVDSL